MEQDQIYTPRNRAATGRELIILVIYWVKSMSLPNAWPSDIWSYIVPESHAMAHLLSWIRYPNLISLDPSAMNLSHILPQNNVIKFSQSVHINCHIYITVNRGHIHHAWMKDSSKFPKSWTSENQNLKLAVCLQNIKNSKLNGQIPLDKLKLNQKSYYYLQNSAFLRLTF